MKKTLIGIAAIAALMTTPVVAADLSVKSAAPPEHAYTYNWSGCYFGGHVGGVFSYEPVEDAGNAGLVAFAPLGIGGQVFPVNANGYFGGGQLGCNYQLGPYVLGLEGDIGAIDLRGSALDPGSTGTSVGISSGTYGDYTARIGLAFGQALLYVKSGGAVYTGHETFSTNVPGFTSVSNTSDFIGYALGGGLEYHLIGNWTGKLEYMHYGFNDKNFTVFAPGGPFFFSEAARIDTVRIGLNYKFDWGGPAVTKY